MYNVPVMKLEITLEKRDVSIKNEALRTSGKIPVIYYMNGKEATSAVVNYVDFVKLYREAGESTMITLKTQDGDKQALVQAFQQDPVTGKVLHIDFKIIEAGKPIEVAIPLEFVGKSPAVSNGLGTLTRAMDEVTVRVLPKDLPSHLDVDISSLETTEDQFLIKDLKVPVGVEILAEPEEAIVVISSIKEEAEEETATEIDFDSITVEKKGKIEKPEDADSE